MSGNGFEFTVRVDLADDTCEVSGFADYRRAVGFFAEQLKRIGVGESASLYDFEGRALFDSVCNVSWDDPLVSLPQPGAYRVEWKEGSGFATDLIPLEMQVVNVDGAEA